VPVLTLGKSYLILVRNSTLLVDIGSTLSFKLSGISWEFKTSFPNN
jgi:hypothetical protein